VAVGALVAVASAAEAAPRIARFDCQIGDGRGVLPREEEEEADDDLICRLRLVGLGRRIPEDLVAELRIVPPVGPYRVVASAAFEPTEKRDRAEVRELVVPHGTWTAAVDWSGRPRIRTRPAAGGSRGPRLRLVLCVRGRPRAGEVRWPILVRRRLDIPAAGRVVPRSGLRRLLPWSNGR
jgi:hypothetical protein